jgi:hypothetical protein
MLVIAAGNREPLNPRFRVKSFNAAGNSTTNCPTPVKEIGLRAEAFSTIDNWARAIMKLIVENSETAR